jgi:hypothetical protein
VDPGRQEAFHDWWVQTFRSPFASTIMFNRYANRSHLQRVTGQATNGYAAPEASTVLSIYSWDAHEAIHVLSHSIGRPSDFWNEGLAVAYSVNPADQDLEPRWQARSVHA